MSGAPAGVTPEAWRLYREAVVIDAHNDLPTKIVDDGYDPDVRHAPADGHTDLPRLIESGITGQFLAAWIDARYAAPGTALPRTLRYLDVIHAFIGRHPDRLVLATTAADVRRAKQSGRVAILIGVEGGHAIENSLDHLRTLHARGARYLTLTWNNGNDWAGSSIGSGGTRTAGLTEFGRSVVREANRIGMLVDVSHVSSPTLADVLEVSTAPVIASHSSARALADHPRNLDDAELRAIAARGGVVCANFFPLFLGTRMRQAMDDAEAATAGGDGNDPDPRAHAQRLAGALAHVPPTPLSVLIDHLDHIARVAGIDHVGLGSDFDGIPFTPAGLEDVTTLPRIAQALLDRGYQSADVAKVLGGNVLRLLERIER